MTAVKKKPKSTNCSDHYTISLITHTTKMVGRIFRRGVAVKIEDALGEDQI